jgi:hypothetical protein
LFASFFSNGIGGSPMATGAMPKSKVAVEPTGQDNNG